MAKFDKAGVSLELDTSDFDSGYKSVLADAGKLDALSPTVKVSVTDTDLKTAVGLVDELDTSTSLKVNVDDSELTTASDKLDDIATIGAIDLAINIAGTAKGLFESAGRFSGVAGLLEMDSALALVQARTGKMIPDAEKLINDLYVNGWGESKTQIAGLVAQAAQLGLEGDNLEAAVLSTLQVVSVTGGDATETLNKLDTAAKANGITFTESADLFVAGYQAGGDKADDLLDTLSEYGTQFKDFGLSAEGALAFLTSGLEAGVFNADTLGDTVKEMGIRFSEIGTTPAITDAFTQLDSLSQIDLSKLLEGYEAGTVLGDDMLQGLFDALAEVAETDRTAATLIAAQLVGTTSEIVGPDVWSQLSTDADTAFGDIEGRAEDAGNAISDTLGVTVDTFLRNIEQMATSFLSSDAVDLDGKIETFTHQLQTAISTAMSGGSIGEVIEAGFGITGIDTALDNISRVFGQFVITLLEIVAAIQDPLGINDADKATRGQIATLATQQLPFDIKVANPEELDSIFGQAAQRGVVDLGGALTTALDELVAEGNFDQVEGILNQILISPDVDAAAAQTLVDKYTKAIDDAVAAQAPPAETDGWWNRLKPPAELDEAKAFSGPSGTGEKGTGWWNSIEVSPETIASLDAADEAVVTLDADVDTAMTNAQLVTGLASQSMIDAFSAITDGVTTADEQIAMAITGNTMTASFDAMSASAAQNVEAAKASFQGLLATVSSVDVRMSAFFNSIMAKVGSVNDAVEGIGTVPDGGTGGTSISTTNINVSSTTNVQGAAQAAQYGYQLGAQIRGMA